MFWKIMYTIIYVLSFRAVKIWANSADPDQTAPRPRSDCSQRSSLIWVCTVCCSVCIFWMHYSMVKPPCSNFMVITANVSGVQIFRSFTVPKYCVISDPSSAHFLRFNKAFCLNLALVRYIACAKSELWWDCNVGQLQFSDIQIFQIFPVGKGRT